MRNLKASAAHCIKNIHTHIVSAHKAAPIAQKKFHRKCFSEISRSVWVLPKLFASMKGLACCFFLMGVLPGSNQVSSPVGYYSEQIISLSALYLYLCVTIRLEQTYVDVVRRSQMKTSFQSWQKNPPQFDRWKRLCYIWTQSATFYFIYIKL